MQQPPTPRHRETIGVNSFTLRPVELIDIMGEPDGLPINFFNGISQEKTIYDQMVEGEAVENRPLKLKALKVFFKYGILTKNGEPFNVDAYFDQDANIETTDECVTLFSAIIMLSFKKFREIKQVEKSMALAIDAISKRYGTQPIENLFPDGGYTSLDAFMFNSYVASLAISKENDEIKKSNVRKRK
jgi:hypothetical protein